MTINFFKYVGTFYFKYVYLIKGLHIYYVQYVVLVLNIAVQNNENILNIQE